MSRDSQRREKNECFPTAAAAAAAARLWLGFHHAKGQKPPALRCQPPFNTVAVPFETLSNKADA